MLAGEPFVEKPPLYYFTAAAFAKLLSPPLPPHDAARLASALWIAIAVLFVWLAGRSVFDAETADIAVVLLLGCIGLIVRAHQLITDTALVAGFAMAVYGLTLCASRPAAGGAWLGTGVGIGFMAKGLLAPGVVGISALALPLVAPTYRTRGYMAALAVALASATPWLAIWPLALHDASPALFREWFWDNNFGRFLGTSHLGPRASHGHYFKILPWYALPVLPLAAWMLWQSRRAIHDGARLLLLTAGVLLAVLWLSADARELYAMPLLVPLALLAAPGALALPASVNARWARFNAIVFSAIALVAWLCWVALEFGVPSAIQQKLLQTSPAYTPGLRWLPLVVAGVFTAAWAVAIRRSCSAAVTWTCGLTLAWTLAMTLYLGWIDAAKSYRPVVQSLQSALPPAYRCISSRGLGEPQRAMLDYYAGIRTKREETAATDRRDCDLLLVQQSAGERVPDEGDVLWQGGRAGDANERLLLLRRR